MSLFLAQAGAFVFSFVPDVYPTPSLEHHLHLGQQTSHTDEGAEFPGVEPHSWDPEVSYRANEDIQSHDSSHFVLWFLQHQQSLQVKLSSECLYLHEETPWCL